MADRPILFSAPMVRALIEGRKTQTRRVLNPQPQGHVWRYGWSMEDGATWSGDKTTARIPIWAGDRLYVREHWRTTYGLDWTVEDLGRPLKPREFDPKTTPVEYLADGERELGGKARRAMHMPRWASRLTLIVTDVKVERLQDITYADAIAEGVEPYGGIDPDCSGYRDYSDAEGRHWVNSYVSYATLWDSINGDGSWADNPWIVAYSFTVVHGNIDQIERAAA